MPYRINYKSPKLSKFFKYLNAPNAEARAAVYAPRVSQPLAPTQTGARERSQSKPAGTGGGRVSSGNMKPASSGGRGAAMGVLSQPEFRSKLSASRSPNKALSLIHI